MRESKGSIWLIFWTFLTIQLCFYRRQSRYRAPRTHEPPREPDYSKLVSATIALVFGHRETWKSLQAPLLKRS